MFRGPRLVRPGWLARLIPGERLSGVLSTTEFQQAFLRERSLVDRRQRPFSLIAFVPASTDDPRALPRLARLLRERLRTADVVGRLNADHLAVLLPATDGHGAWVVAESILHRLASAGLKFDCKVYVYPCEAPADRGGESRRAGDADSSGTTDGGRAADTGAVDGFAAAPTSSDALEFPAASAALVVEDALVLAAPLALDVSAVATATTVAARASATGAARSTPRVAATTRTAVRDSVAVPTPIDATVELQPIVHQLVAALPSTASRAQSAPRQPAGEPGGSTRVTIDRHGDLRSGPYTDAAEGSRELDAIRASSSARPIHDLRPFLVEPLPTWKRSMDVAVSSLLLLALAPLFLAIAIAIKLDSAGPIIFRQKRAGAGGRPFTFFKFRSMHPDAEARRAALEALNEKDGPIFKIKNDPRLTRVGAFLRKWSLDELPQIYNVLRGDMSLVGPRPPTLNELPGYQAWQRRRLELTGGLTCIWQVSGRSDVSFEEWMRMDLRYARSRTFGQDVLLICKTAGAILSGRGAY